MSYARKASAGYTIIELMVSITIGLIILAALVTLFAGNSRERGDIERANQQTENGRYAMQEMSDDLRAAGYLATFNPGTVLGPNAQLSNFIPAALPNVCATDVATLTGAMSLPVQGFYQPAAAPACLADWRAGTDILVVRRTSTCSVGTAGCDPQVAGDVYFQASGCNTETSANQYFAIDTNVGNLNLHLKDCATAAPIYQLRTHIYFVANDDKGADGIPTLKRAELGNPAAPGAFTIVPLVEGVDNLQLEYGIDIPDPNPTVGGLPNPNYRQTSGSPAVYSTDPGVYSSPVYGACAAQLLPWDCLSNWRNTVAVKIYVLARNLTTTQGYQDTKTYTLGLTPAGAANVVGPFNDGYKRHAYSTVAVLYNTAGRNTP